MQKYNIGKRTYRKEKKTKRKIVELNSNMPIIPLNLHDPNITIKRQMLGEN